MNFTDDELASMLRIGQHCLDLHAVDVQRLIAEAL